MLLFLLGTGIAALVSGAVFYFLKKKKESGLPPAPPEKGASPEVSPPRQSTAEADLSRQSTAEAERIVAEAQGKAREIKARAVEVEERLSRREESLEQRAGVLEKRESRLSEKESSLEKDKVRLGQELERRAGLTKKEAGERLLKSLSEELVSDRARLLKEADEQVGIEVDERAREALVSAMVRSATDYVPETTVSRVTLPSEDTKGRIIGREGRNIKALEEATGVDFDIDETPQEVRISSFDPLRREVARRTLELLVADGRIQPTRIEETVSRVKQGLGREVRQRGKDLAYRAGVADLPGEALDLLGKLTFRTSYGQNQAEHTLEVVNLAKALAQEVGAREGLVAKAALLHDIGKVRTVEEGEGSHIELGRVILKRLKFSDELIHTALAHHRDEEFQNIEAALVYIADAISGSRPGARFEDYEKYTQRIVQLEEVAKGFAGVREAYAISAGREVRVLVEPEQVSDNEAKVLAHDIAAKIQVEATYPGTVKVNVIREVRVSETAK